MDTKTHKDQGFPQVFSQLVEDNTIIHTEPSLTIKMYALAIHQGVYNFFMFWIAKVWVSHLKFSTFMTLVVLRLKSYGFSVKTLL